MEWKGTKWWKEIVDNFFFLWQLMWLWWTSKRWRYTLWSIWLQCRVLSRKSFTYYRMRRIVAQYSIQQVSKVLTKQSLLSTPRVRVRLRAFAFYAFQVCATTHSWKKWERNSGTEQRVLFWTATDCEKFDLDLLISFAHPSSPSSLFPSVSIQ